MSPSSLFAHDKVSSCVLYRGRRCVPRASPLEFPGTHFFPAWTGPRNNEITSARSPAGGQQSASALGFASVSFANPSGGGNEEREEYKKEKRKTKLGSSLIIHHRVQTGETKMAASLSANTYFHPKRILPAVSLALPPQAWINEHFICPSTLFSASKRVVRAPCLADTSRDYQFSSVDDSKDSKEKNNRHTLPGERWTICLNVTIIHSLCNIDIAFARFLPLLT